MDHLPSPKDARLPPVIVPYHPTYQYDKGSFAEYPARCGFDKAKFRWRDFRGIPHYEQTSFFQAWLFFGVLHEALRANFGGFINRDDQTITTTHLLSCIRKWKDGLSRYSRTQKQEERERVGRCLREARDVLCLIEGHEMEINGGNSVTPEVSLSIITLGLTIGEGIRTPEYDSRGGWPISGLAMQRFKATGWCQSEINRLEHFIFTTGFLFLGSMPVVERQADHASCTETRCTADDIDDDSYRTAHTKQCGSGHGVCLHIGPVLADVTAILESGNIPILALTRKTNPSSVFIKAVPYSRLTTYTAISHVWADGLGNPAGNTLPQCQVSRIHDLLTKLGQNSKGLSLTRAALGMFAEKNTVHVWMDTLCVPLQKTPRKMAISRMYDVYQNATKVLLLDNPLLDVSASSSAEELCFRLTASAWMRRAWTMQEGVLSRSLFVQFAERPVYILDLVEELFNRTTGTDSWNVTLLESCSVLVRLDFTDLTVYTRGTERFTAYHEGLKDRSTSHIEDKELCLAIMLKMDMERIQDASDEKRTMLIYEQLEQIPQGFFWHNQPSLAIPGFNWAPKAIFSVSAINSPNGHPLTLSKSRLSLMAAGLVFRVRSHYMEDSAPLDPRNLYIKDDSTGQWYRLAWKTGHRASARSKSEWTVLAVITQWGDGNMTPIREGVVIRPGLPYTTTSSFEEVLEAVEHSDTISGDFIGRASVEALDEASLEEFGVIRLRDQWKRQMKDYRELVRVGEASLEGEELKWRRWYEENDESWCVSKAVALKEQQWCVR